MFELETQPFHQFLGCFVDLDVFFNVDSIRYYYGVVNFDMSANSLIAAVAAKLKGIDGMLWIMQFPRPARTSVSSCLISCFNRENRSLSSLFERISFCTSSTRSFVGEISGISCSTTFWCSIPLPSPNTRSISYPACAR